jgi:hypothetical protein
MLAFSPLDGRGLYAGNQRKPPDHVRTLPKIHIFGSPGVTSVENYLDPETSMGHLYRHYCRRIS